MRITVEDNGLGFSVESQRDAFEPFYTTKSTTGGAGLGLTMVDGFVRRNDGQVNILYSKPHRTWVEMILPQVSISRQQVSAENSGVSLLTGSGETILVVEDRDELLDVLCAMLSSLNYNVVCADNATDALSILDSDSPIALVIADVMLGDALNGVEMMKIANQIKPEMKVIYTSGYAGDRRDITLPKHQPFLQKPFTIEVLSKTVDQLISRSLEY